jgi:hypothetical protein
VQASRSHKADALELAQIDHGRNMANFRFVHAEQIAKVLKVLDGDEGD